ncbi:MAG: GNAT family N-acetyltransferase [Paracoccaceae bacterium]
MNALLPALRVEVLPDIAALDRIAADWQALHAAAEGGPFSSLNWIMATMATFGPGGDSPLLALVWEGDRLIAGLALRKTRARLSRHGPRASTLRMLCDQRVGFHEVLALPGREGPAMAALAAELLADPGWTLLDLTPMLPSPALAELRQRLQSAGLALWQRPEIRRAICDMSGGFDAYLDRHSRNFRRSLRKTATAVEAGGGRVLQARGLGPDDLNLLDRALAVSARCWKAQAGTDLGTHPEDRAFTTALWHRLAPRGALRLLLLEMPERDAAAVFMLREGRREYGWVCDFDEDFAQLSPGRFLISRALETASADGIELVDFMRLTPFTERFADRLETYDRLRLCRPLSLPRLWIAVEERLRPLGSSLRRRYRQHSRKRGAYKDAMADAVQDRNKEDRHGDPD